MWYLSKDLKKGKESVRLQTSFRLGASPKRLQVPTVERHSRALNFSLEGHGSFKFLLLDHFLSALEVVLLSPFSTSRYPSRVLPLLVVSHLWLVNNSYVEFSLFKWLVCFLPIDSTLPSVISVFSSQSLGSGGAHDRHIVGVGWFDQGKSIISYSTYCYRIRMWRTLNETFSDGKQGDWATFKFLKVAVELHTYKSSMWN